MSSTILSDAGQVIQSEDGSGLLAENTATSVLPSAVGSQADMARRIRAVLPTGWFAESAPVLDGVLAGLGSIWAFLWSLLSYVNQQKRISTATDINLDIISADFLGTSLPRKSGEGDALYRQRIKSSIFTEMGTRHAVSRALTLLTGSAPTIFEPRNATDTGGRGARGAVVNTGLGYGVAGGYGSYALPFQAFIQTNLPQVVGIAGVQGYGSAGRTFGSVVGGYNAGAIEYNIGSLALLSASDTEIYDVVNAVKPVATIMWVATDDTNPLTSPDGPPLLDISFVLDTSRMS